MFCVNCGKEILDGAVACPICGTTQQKAAPMASNISGHTSSPNQSTVQKAHYNTLCVVGFVISFISLLINFWGLIGITGTIVSIAGLSSCKQKNQNGKALAIIGIFIGIFSIFYGIHTIMSLV